MAENVIGPDVLVGVCQVIGPDVLIDALCCSTDMIPPETPDMPEVAASCESGIVVTSPTFSEEEGAFTETIEVERSYDDGLTWVYAHTFEDELVWIDTEVPGSTYVVYRARACNEAGCSDWTDATAQVRVVSTTVTAEWVSPATGGGPFVNEIELLYSFSDTDGDTSNHRIYANRRLLSEPLLLLQGDLQEGVMHRTWDTRREFQGTVILRLEVTGSDGCIVADEITVTLENTRFTGVMYRDYFLAHQESVENEYNRAFPSVWLGPLDAAASKKFWGQAAIYSDRTKAIVTGATAADAAQAAFIAMQPVPLSETRNWITRGYTDSGRLMSIKGGVTVGSPGRDLILRIRQEAKQTAIPFDTGSNRVAKIRKLSDTSYLVFAKDPDKVFTYDGTDLTLLMDFGATYGFTDVQDVHMRADKLYFIHEDKLYAYDTNSTAPTNKRIILIHPLGEMRPAVAIELVAGKLVVIYSDGDLPSQRTVAATLEADQLEPAWTLDSYVQVVWQQTTSLFIGAGRTLYQSLDGSGTPVAQNDVAFPANITAIGPMAVGLSNGDVNVLVNGVWSQPGGTVPGTPVGGIAAWIGSQETLHYVFGAGSDIVYEQDSLGSWDDGFQLEPPEGVSITVDKITAMLTYKVGGEIVDGQPTTPLDERLLIGIGNDGILYDLSVSRLNETGGAWEFSTIEDVTGTGVSRVVPEDSEGS